MKIKAQALVAPVMKTVQFGAKVTGAILLWKSARKTEDPDEKQSKLERVAEIIDEAANVLT